MPLHRSAPRRRRGIVAAALACALAGCAREELVHGLDEGQANGIVVALGEAGVVAEKRRDDAVEGAWRVDVPGADAARAHAVVAERELSRPRAPGFAEVFGKGSVVPTPAEERALYLHALSGELARTVEAVDGVLAARVHLALPAPDGLRLDAPAPPRASLLVKARPGARAALEALAPGLRALVAGAVPGLSPEAVAVVVAEGAAAAAPPPRGGSARRAALLALAGVAALAGVGAPLAARRWPLTSGRWPLAPRTRGERSR